MRDARPHERSAACARLDSGCGHGSIAGRKDARGTTGGPDGGPSSHTIGFGCSFPDAYVDPYPAFYDELAKYARER